MDILFKAAQEVESIDKKFKSDIHYNARNRVARILSKKARESMCDGAWIEYPILPEFRNKLLDEIIITKKMEIEQEKYGFDVLVKKYPKTCVKQINGVRDWIPTYTYCINQGYIPKTVADIVVPFQGKIIEIWEIIDISIGISNQKLDILRSIGIPIYGISAKWVMSKNLEDTSWQTIENLKKNAVVFTNPCKKRKRVSFSKKIETYSFVKYNHGV
jgi:hypothetical protein